MAWSFLISTTGSDQLVQVIATPGDWRAMAGILALAWFGTMAAMLVQAKGARSERRIYTKQIVDLTIGSANDMADMTEKVITALEASAAAKSDMAAALFTQTTILAQIQSTRTAP